MEGVGLGVYVCCFSKLAQMCEKILWMCQKCLSKLYFTPTITLLNIIVWIYYAVWSKGGGGLWLEGFRKFTKRKLKKPLPL